MHPKGGRSPARRFYLSLFIVLLAGIALFAGFLLFKGLFSDLFPFNEGLSIQHTLKAAGIQSLWNWDGPEYRIHRYYSGDNFDFKARGNKNQIQDFIDHPPIKGLISKARFDGQALTLIDESKRVYIGAKDRTGPDTIIGPAPRDWLESPIIEKGVKYEFKIPGDAIEYGIAVIDENRGIIYVSGNTH